MFEFSELHPDEREMDEIVDLYSDYLNYGSGIRPHLRRVFGTPDTIAFGGTDKNGRIAGIAIYTKGVEFSCGHFDLCRKIREKTNDGIIYTGEGLVVSNDARHNRIHYRLNEMVRGEILKRAQFQGKKAYVVHELWVHPDGRIPAWRVVNEVYGVKEDLGVYKDFYKDFHHFGYVCKVCNGPCKCSAKIILSEITPEELANAL